MSELKLSKLLEFDAIISTIRPIKLQNVFHVLVGTMNGTLGLWNVQNQPELVEITYLESPVSIVCDVYYFDDYAVTYLSTYSQDVYMVKMSSTSLDIRRLKLRTVINRTLITDKSIIMSGAELYVAKHNNGIIDMSTLIGSYAPDDATFKVAFVKGKHLYQTTHEGSVYKVVKQNNQLNFAKIPSLVADAATGFVDKSGLYMIAASVHGHNEQYRKGSLCRVYKETAEDNFVQVYEYKVIPVNQEFPYPDVTPVEDYGGCIAVTPNRFILVTEKLVKTYTHSQPNELRSAPMIYKGMLFYATWSRNVGSLFVDKTTIASDISH